MPSSMRHTRRSKDDLRRHHSDGAAPCSDLTRLRSRTIERKSLSGLGWTVNGQRINVGPFGSAIVENPPPIVKAVFDVDTDDQVRIAAAVAPAAPA